MGEYVTKGRAGEIYKRLDELERLLEDRCAELARRIDEAVELELALARGRIGAELEIVRDHGRRKHGAAD